MAEGAARRRHAGGARRQGAAGPTVGPFRQRRSFRRPPITHRALSRISSHFLQTAARQQYLESLPRAPLDPQLRRELDAAAVPA